MGGARMATARTLSLAGLLAAAIAGGAAAQDAAPAGDQPAFDNPTLASVPCVVLNRYDVAPSGHADGATQYRASASVENICGRTLDVEFCFLTAAAEGGEAGRSCYGAALRPGASAEVNAPGADARVVGTDYRWKYRQP